MLFDDRASVVVESHFQATEKQIMQILNFLIRGQTLNVLLKIIRE